MCHDTEYPVVNRRGGWFLPATLVLLAWLTAGVGTSSATERGQLTLSQLTDNESHSLAIEVARTPQERARGLMERESLDEKAGMLFVYTDEQPASSGYWMYRTRIPLDIAFIDGQGVIRSITTMTPCRTEQASACPSYPAQAPFRAALETNAGYFAKRGIQVGDRIELAPWLETR